MVTTTEEQDSPDERRFREFIRELVESRRAVPFYRMAKIVDEEFRRQQNSGPTPGFLTLCGHCDTLISSFSGAPVVVGAGGAPSKSAVRRLTEQRRGKE